MKATEIQERICDFIISQAYWWKGCDDIDSTTNIESIKECLYAEFSDDLLYEDIDKLENYISALLIVIKNI